MKNTKQPYYRDNAHEMYRVKGWENWEWESKYYQVVSEMLLDKKNKGIIK